MSQIKTALLSYGMSGKVFHAPFLGLHPGFELAGCWERSKKLIRETYPNVKSYDTLEEILTDNTIDLVIVNTPIDTHFEFAKKALLAGKHIVVEKAFTTTVAEAVELKSIAERQKKKITVFHNRRWDSDFKTVKKILNEKWLGTINEAEIHFDRYKPALSSKPHKELPTPGNGALKDLGPHIIDQALVLFGWPDKLFADIRITRIDSLIDDWFDIMLYYPTVRVRLKAGYLVREPLPAYIFHGAKGSFIKTRSDVQEADLTAGKNPGDNNWGFDKDCGLLHTEINGEVIRENVDTLPGNYFDFYEALFQSLTENKPMPVSVDDGIAVMQIIESAVASSQRGETILLGVI